MIKVNHLLDGLFYYTNCLMCNEPMSIRNEGLNPEHKGAANRHGFSLIFNLEKIDKVTINPVTEEVTLDIFKYNTEYIDVKSTAYSDVHYCSNYNHECFLIDVACNKCCNFHYSIDVLVDLQFKKIDSVFITQIVFTLVDNGRAYLVINDLYNKKTSLIDSSSECTLLETALIEFDAAQPDLFLNRLKKLIIFS